MNRGLPPLLSSLIVFVGLSSPILAQVTQPEPKAGEPKPVSSDLFGLGNATKAAADLRQAAEAFDRLGNSLKELVPPIAEALVKMSQHLADLSKGFDPFGYKAAFQTIAEQNETIRRQHETIQELLRADIARLQRELDRTRNSASPPKATKRKKRKESA